MTVRCLHDVQCQSFTRELLRLRATAYVAQGPFFLFFSFLIADNIFYLDVHYACYTMLVQRFEPQGRLFVNLHYYYYYGYYDYDYDDDDYNIFIERELT